MQDIEISNIDRRKGGYYVNYTHSQSVDGESEDTFIKSDVLREHVKDNELNTMKDFPSYGDITPLDLPTWIEENETEAIKHYLTNKN